MKKQLIFKSAAALFLFSHMTCLSSFAAPVDHARAEARLIFKCTLDGGSYTVTEKDGAVSFSGGPYQTYPVSLFTDSQGDARTYVFKGANVIDGVPHNLAFTIGTDNNPDSVSSDGDVFTCRYKATINSAVLDALVQKTNAQILKDILAKRSELGLCKEATPGDFGYGLDLLQVERDDSSRVVAIACMMGAYQGTYNMVRWNPETRSGKLIATQNYNSDTGAFEKTYEFTGMPYYEQETAKFFNTLVFRGIGDCGIQTEFLPYQGELQLKTKFIRSKPECDGRFVPPNQWPVIYPAR